MAGNPGSPGPRQAAPRRKDVPAVRYPAGLPIIERKDEIRETIRLHPVVIVAGETGSGKSTQLPKICLELGRGVHGMIGHTQPRRLAARAVAERIAEELDTIVGGPVGYAVRFTDRVGEDTLVKVMTDGILLAEIQRDRLLTRYDTVIVDEAHERSLNVDFLLGYLKQLLPRRPDLKVIVTSATIDTERFSRHFDGAPIIEVSGRAHAVEMRYRAVVQDAGEAGRDQTQAICEAVGELSGEGPGDILVFLSGEREIRDAADALTAANPRATEILPLYARLSTAEQHRVFRPHPGRRIVLATNVAETSLTVPGIRYVVDAGTARISRYSRRTKVQRLPIEAVSRASANQRAGRCGRVAPGICIRLYSEEDFVSRPEFTEPEILRTNLASVILQMTAIGLGDVAGFPFVDPPDSGAINDGMALLDELGALEPGEKSSPRPLTPLGRRLARLPLDPRLGRMVLEAGGNGCLREVMVIAAALSIQDPRERPATKRQAADELHRRFVDPDSDFLAYWRLWQHTREHEKVLSSSQFRRLCRAEFLNYLRVREWQDIYSQLRQATASLGLRINTEPGDPDQIHRSLLSGLLSHIGLREGEGREYKGARNARFVLAPGSGLKHPPRWVMAAELVETNRLWARVVARIQPSWAERAGGHLLKRTYSEPYWDAERGTSMANESVTLYGLPLATARKVDYGGVDPGCARELFIVNALIGGAWRPHHKFWAENQRLVGRVRALEDRARRRDLLVDEGAMFDFYDGRVGPHVVSARQFDSWWKKERTTRPRLLDFTLDLLLSPAAPGVDAAGYPDAWLQDGLSLPLSYVFSPGSDDDGVTVHIPSVLLHQVDGRGFDWQIAGLRHELVVALLRSLPKAVRRDLGPAAELASAFLERAAPADGPLLEVLGREVGRVSGVAVPLNGWELDRIPAHLRLIFCIEEEGGRVLAAGKDLDVLKAGLQSEIRLAVSRAAGAIEQAGLRTWSFGTLPRSVEFTTEGNTARAYPAIVDEEDSVALRMVESGAEQGRAHWAGTRRLLRLNVRDPVPDLQRRLSNPTSLLFAAGVYPSAVSLLEECVECALDELIAEHGGPAWDEAGFTALLDAARDELAGRAGDIVAGVARVLLARSRIVDRLDAATAPALQPAVGDIRSQLDRLVHPGFIATAGSVRLQEIPRYLEAIEIRLDKAPRAPGRDHERMRSVQRLEQDYEHLLTTTPLPMLSHQVLQVRWMIEELRVSYFAQSLGTRGPVSEQRIRRVLEACGLQRA